MEKLIDIYKGLYKTAKVVQERIKRYYNLKRLGGPDLEEGSKVQLLYKNLISRRLSKRLDYVKIGLFKVLRKILEVNYKLDLLERIRIHPVQYITIIEPVQGDAEPPIYK